MSTGANAEECRKASDASTDDEERARWLKLAEQWLNLAEQWERNHPETPQVSNPTN